MKAVVTGGQGFIGSHVVDRLLSEGYEVHALDNQSAECNEEFYTNSRAIEHAVDICNFHKVKEIFEGAEVVFHLAAESRIQPAILNPILATQINVVGTCSILQAARECEVKRVVYSSTSAGYGLQNEPPLREDMPNDCLNPYAVTKCAGEDLCVMYHHLFGLNTVSLRYFNVYGDRQPLQGQYAPVVGLFLRQRDNGEPLTIVGDGLQRRDFTHVDDIVEANFLAATTDNKEAFGEVFNVGTGTNFSVLEVAQLISSNYIHIPARQGEARHTLADNSKIRKILKWKPSHSIEDWIAKYLKESAANDS